MSRRIWSILIIRDTTLGGIRRFSELQRHLGAAKNILTTRLKALVDHGILEVVPASDGSAYSEYLSTAKGRVLMPVLVALAQWGKEYLYDMGEACNVPVDSTHEAPLATLKLVAEDGRELAPTEVLIAPRDTAWTDKVAREGPHNWKVSRLAPRPLR